MIEVVSINNEKRPIYISDSIIMPSEKDYLKIGSKYIAEEVSLPNVFASGISIYYLIEGSYYLRSNFITLEEYRNNQINKINL